MMSENTVGDGERIETIVVLCETEEPYRRCVGSFDLLPGFPLPDVGDTLDLSDFEAGGNQAWLVIRRRFSVTLRPWGGAGCVTQVSFTVRLLAEPANAQIADDLRRS